MPVSVTIAADNSLPVRTTRGVQFVSMTDTYTMRLRGLTVDQCRKIAEVLPQIEPGFVLAERVEVERGAPDLPREFRRQLEID